ncbi:hypothetical protein BAUCODRAFT_75967 [Baudoinia panamericana UAMH 10762]|uniref:Mitochondrial inner membrane protease ATP23 n=1 Tax=Baudoinia panamericana (strain UAMH 10762) TaxID=717646 RepID=M2LH67_BAUPA|nr:uncharacterized protein BAUCODRAFT_75967 [Baudoinia panamericana UAMH 10762]EMC93472.1 hypothetical protein BAUCODRAFT_75967 [Baudoinia panamericana UAMH 10762]
MAGDTSTPPPPPPTTSSTTSSTAKSALGHDPIYYTWSTAFTLLSAKYFNTPTPPDLARNYFRERDILREEKDCAKCTADVKYLLAYSPIIRFMKHNIDLLGPADGSASINETNVRCKRCEGGQSGGWDAEYGILLCANEFRNQGHLEDTLAHEMVHAYDHLRFKVDGVNDLRHAACMEIRASTLSGECRWAREFFTRGQWNLTQQLQECVRRRATLSVSKRPGCVDDVQAARVVNEVWDKCFTDTRPFDEIYR